MPSTNPDDSPRRGRDPARRMEIDVEYCNALMNRVRGRDDALAFDELHRHCGGKLLGHLAKRLSNLDLAEDVSQEVWLRIWKGRSNWREENQNFWGWLLTIASRVVASFVKGAEPAIAGKVDVESRHVNSIDEIDLAEILLLEFIRRTESHRETLRWWYWPPPVVLPPAPGRPTLEQARLVNRGFASRPLTERHEVARQAGQSVATCYSIRLIFENDMRGHFSWA